MTTHDHMTRRTLLSGGAVIPLLPAFWPNGKEQPVISSGRRPKPKAPNIIFMVSDGMSAGVPMLAEPFSQLVRGTGTHWHALAKDAATAFGYLQTDSLSSMVTDSSAASSAWSSGSRVFNGALNVLPNGMRLTPIGRLAKRAGKALGLVTTTTVTHATPAGFAAVQPSRDDQDAIALDYLDVVDVALGGGNTHFAASLRRDRRDVYAAYRQRGYRVCTTRDELRDARGAQRLLGCFSDGHMPYTIDQLNQAARYRHVPTLAEMTAIALETLSAAGEGFLLQIEGGRVDHAAHANDAAAILWDQLAFDDAVGVALEFLADHPDTLLVITTDHGNANPGLNGMGARYAESTRCFERLAPVTGSFDTIHAAMQEIRDGEHMISPAHAAQIVQRYTDITITDEEAAAIAHVINGGHNTDLHRHHRGIVGALGQTLANHTGIGWTGTTHTADLALTLTVGAARERFAGLRHHTDVFTILTSLMGINHINPSMSADEARRYVARAPTEDVQMHYLAAV